MNTRAVVFAGCILALAAAALGDEPAAPATQPVTVTTCPAGVMDTECELTVVVAPGQQDKAERALKAAEAALRSVESHMSSHLKTTELYRLNAAEVGVESPLSKETLDLLKQARKYADETCGVFDVTCRPLLEMWKTAGQANRLPTDAEMKEAMDRTGWANFKLTDSGAVKLKKGAGIDLGGIAKKYAIDRAADAMLAEGGLIGGLVNVGGDLRCFGRPADGDEWRVGVRDPFDPKSDDFFGILAIKGGAICTSGNYERFVVIDGQRYSHIVDPRTGRPANAIPSVTVIGSRALTGVWATALSVLGPDGFKLIPPDSGIEAMVVTGGPKDYKVHMTDGFKKYFLEPPPQAAQPATAPSSRPAD